MARILVVDDSLYVRYTLFEMLTSGGHDVFEATNGVEAVEHFRNLRPDIVLLDLVLPQKSGLSVLQEIRAMDTRAAVAVLSAHASDHNVRAALAAGAVDFIVKPIRRARLLASVEKAIR